MEKDRHSEDRVYRRTEILRRTEIPRRAEIIGRQILRKTDSEKTEILGGQRFRRDRDPKENKKSEGTDSR